jgi:hypothetical protein
VLAVAAIVTVTALHGSSGTDTERQRSRPFISPTATIDATWQHESWGTVSWRTPAGWLPSAAYPDHSRPSNDIIEGPYIGTARFPVTSPSPRPVLGTGVLGSAGPVLPPDAAVAWFTYGQRSTQRLSDGPPFAETAPEGLKAQCAALGAAAIFHAVRQFGSQAHGSNLALDGCLSGTDTALFSAQLSAVLASASDSAYPATALGSPAPTTAPSVRAAGPSPTATASGTTAQALCHSALGSVATASPTTVGVIRAYRVGPAEPTSPHGFPSAASGEPAAWCWVHDMTQRVNLVYAVHAGDSAILMVTIGGVAFNGGVHSGEPQLP